MTPLIPSVVSVLDDPDALVPPAFWHCPEYVETIGPEVADLNRLFGYGPNPEQQLLLDGNFGMDRRGRLTAFEVFVLASRQNLKTGFFIQRAIGKALLLRRPLQVWTAHKESATDQAFAEFQKMAERSAEFSRRVKKMPEGKGSKAVEFVNDCTIVFRPRTGKAGQSMSADDVDMDEYFAVEPKHEGSLVPTLSTRPNAQIGEASSAPHEGSDMQRMQMARGRAAALGLTQDPRFLYAEWSPMRRIGETRLGKPKFGPPPCATPECSHELGVEGCIADNREVIKLANPSAGRTTAPAITWDYIADERRKLQGEALGEYFKERLSIGVEDDDVAVTAIHPDLWQAREASRPAPEPEALGIAVSRDRVWASLGAYGDRYLGAVRHDHYGQWLIEETVRIALERDLAVGVDGKGPAASLIPTLRDRGVRVEECTTEDYITSAADLYDGLVDGTYEHGDHADLNDAAAVAGWRQIGDRRVWARISGDITMLEADTFALYAALRSNTEPFAMWG